MRILENIVKEGIVAGELKKVDAEEIAYSMLGLLLDDRCIKGVYEK